MATIRATSPKPQSGTKLPPLEPGDHLDRATFHERYKKMPEKVKVELVGGIVIMPAALRNPHGEFHALLMAWLGTYWIATPGTGVVDNATILLSEDSEPQPDACVRIVGGRTHVDEDDYLVGPPELVVEVASSSASYDLHSKRLDYERAGVAEYLVLVLRESRAAWFRRENEAFVEMQPSEDGLLRSQQFPGLWLEPQAFFRSDGQRVVNIVNQGLASPEHARFVERLKNR